MVFHQSAKEEIKKAADVVDVIGQYVDLKKSGRNYMGLCPFHSEKAPSFTVNRERQTFHCFGCKKGGDVFSFWMEYHSTTFPEAIRDLAERYQIPITEKYSAETERKRAEERNTLYKINEIALNFFQKTLNHSTKGGPARNYLQKRAIPDGIINQFQLGFAPREWDGLVKVLQSHRIKMELAVQSGMIIQKERGGYYDRFRGRIMFPIVDQRQHVIGFGGRVLDDSLPKYLNSPETPIFNKGACLYGLHSSFNAIRERGRAVIVEGYMDWLSLKKHGLHEAVATLGTALTDKHVRKLRGFAKEAMIVFDSDEAGKAAALKSLHVFANEGLSAKAVVLPAGHDPDTYINENGLDRFQGLLDQALPLVDFFLEQKLGMADSDEAKVAVLKEILPVLQEIQDFSLRSLYVKRLAEKAGIREDVVLAALKEQLKMPHGAPIKTPRTAGLAKSKSEFQLLHLFMNHPQVIPRLIQCGCRELVGDPIFLELIDITCNKYDRVGIFSPEDLLEEEMSEVCREQLREALHNPFAIYSDEDIEQAVIEFERKAHSKKINTCLQTSKKDPVTLNELLNRKRQGLVVS